MAMQGQLRGVVPEKLDDRREETACKDDAHFTKGTAKTIPRYGVPPSSELMSHEILETGLSFLQT